MRRNRFPLSHGSAQYGAEVSERESLESHTSRGVRSVSQLPCAPAYQASRQGYTSVYAVKHCELPELNVNARIISAGTRLCNQCLHLENSRRLWLSQVRFGKSSPDKFLLDSRDCGMFFPARVWAFSEKAMGCRKTGPEFGNTMQTSPFQSPFHEETRVFASLAVASLAIRI